MEPFRIERMPVVHGGGLREPIVLKDVKVVSGTEFFCLMKTDNALLRMFTGKSWKTRRPMSGSPVLEMVKELRQKEIDRIINPPAAADLGVDDADSQPKKRMKSSLLEVPEVVSIRMPPIEHHPGMTAKILKGKHRDPVWIELAPGILDYIAAAVRSEVNEPSNHQDDGGEGVTRVQYIAFCKMRQAFRVRFNGKSKWFPIASHPDAMHEAQAFLASLKEGVSSDSVAADV